MSEPCDHENPSYFRSECGFCGEQDALCNACDAQLCGCKALSETSGIDLGAPSSTPGSPSATEGLEGSQIFDPVERPAHYQWLPVEAIEITERFNFNMGNALKYIIRADHKGKPIEDLRKAAFYISRELKRRGYDSPGEST